MSFSLFGLLIIFITGMLIIILSFCVDSLVGWIQRRWRLDPYPQIEWMTNQTLQLQRLAHEAMGLGSWEGGTNFIPVQTEKHVELAALDLSDPRHPRYRPPEGSLRAISVTEELSAEKKGVN